MYAPPADPLLGTQPRCSAAMHACTGERLRQQLAAPCVPRPARPPAPRNSCQPHAGRQRAQGLPAQRSGAARAGRRPRPCGGRVGSVLTRQGPGAPARQLHLAACFILDSPALHSMPPASRRASLPTPPSTGQPGSPGAVLLAGLALDARHVAMTEAHRRRHCICSTNGRA